MLLLRLSTSVVACAIPEQEEVEDLEEDQEQEGVDDENEGDDN